MPQVNPANHPNKDSIAAEDLPPWLSADELEEVARRQLEPATYDYIAGGAGEERTLAANRRGFELLALRPRILTGAHEVTTQATLFGMSLAAPLFVSPMGGPAHALVHPEGVLGTALGAAQAGVAYMVSGSSAPTLDIPGDARICQVYLVDRDVTTRLMGQAEQLGYGAVCLTADVPVSALRRRNLRHGKGIPAGTAEPVRGGFANPEFYARTASWKDVEWMRSIAKLPLIVKGVMTGEDARIAVELGVDGVVVSNHGGRQIDHALGTIEVLPEVVDAVAGGATVMIDGGVRTSTDVAIALALGAQAVGMGKAVMWAYAAAGAPGVANFLKSIITDLTRTMALLGVANVADLGPAFVDERHAVRRRTQM
jgi:isopentenyl diphosphate isomerase/L-lactate dehydrogenase-like FMN-dependent dehydrogenase